MTIRLASHHRRRIPIKRDQVFQRRFVLGVRDDVRSELKRLVSVPEALSYACRKYDSLHGDRSIPSQVHAFWWACEALRLHAVHGGLAQDEVERLLRSTKAVLTRYNVRPRTSRVALLHEALHEVVAQLAHRNGDGFAGAWHELLARYKGGDSPHHPEVYTEQFAELELGGRHYHSLLWMDAELMSSESRSAAAPLARARMLRLTGQFDEARSVVAWHAPSGDDAIGRELLWEQACIETGVTGSLSPQTRLLRLDRRLRLTGRTLELRVWTHATQSKQWLGACPRVATLRRSARAAGHPLDEVMYGCAQQLEGCHQTAAPLSLRLERLGGWLSRVAEIERADHQLLIWAAATRWLVRVKRKRMAALTHHCYEQLSLYLSGDHCRDPLGALRDISIAVRTSEPPSQRPHPPMRRRLQSASSGAG